MKTLNTQNHTQAPTPKAQDQNTPSNIISARSLAWILHYQNNNHTATPR